MAVDFWTGKKVLITGASGFIGSHLCAELSKLDLSLLFAPASVNFDLRQPYDIEGMFKYHPIEFDILINLAANVGGIGYNQNHPYSLFYDNIQIGVNLIHAAIAHKVKKFVQIGTVCLTEDTFIRVGNLFKNINQLDNGNCVEGQSNPSRILKKFVRDYSGNLIVIRPVTGEEIKSTPEHPFLVKRSSNITWIRASEILPNDILLLKIPERQMNDVVYLEFSSALPRTRKRYQSRLEIDNELAWLLGIFLAEGNINNSRGKSNKHPQEIQFNCHIEEYDIYNKIKKIIRDKFGLESQDKNGDGQAYTITFSNNQLAGLFNNIFYVNGSKGCYNKTVPDELFNAPNSIIVSFLRGYFDGDGHISKREYVNGNKINCASSVSISRNISYQIKDLLLWLKIVPSIHKRIDRNPIIQGRKVNVKPSWEVKITGSDVDKFIYLVYPELRSELPSKRRKPRNEKVFNRGFVEVPILDIKEEYQNTKVYNIQTESQTYTANGVVVHNCAYPKFTPVPFQEACLWDGYPEETNAPYGIAKRVTLTQLQAARQEYGFNGIYILPTNLYGPGDNFNENQSHVIPALIKKFIDAKRQGLDEVEVWGTGTASRDFLYTKDAISGIMLLAEKYDKPEPVNLGSGNEVRIMALAHLIQKLTGFEGTVRWDSSKPDGQPRRGLRIWTAKQLGWSPQTSLEDGLKETIEFYLTK